MALKVEALLRLETEPARDEGRRPRWLQVVEPGPVLTADGEEVAKSLRCDEGDGRAAAFEHGVRRHCRTVYDLIRPPAAVMDAGQHGPRRVGWRGRRLEDLDGAVALLEVEVGKGATD